MKRGDRARWKTSMGDVAVHVLVGGGPQTQVVMVGDDHVHYVDPSDLSPLDDDEFCGGCGQIGCGHG